MAEALVQPVHDNNQSKYPIIEDDNILPDTNDIPSVVKSRPTVPNKTILHLDTSENKSFQGLSPIIFSQNNTRANPNTGMVNRTQENSPRNSPRNSPSPRMNYIRTLHRRGNTYMIRDSLPSEEDIVETDGTDRMITDLYSDTLHMSSSANRKAEIFKFLYILSSFFTTIAGSIIGVLSIQDHETNTTNYIAGILGFVVAAVQALLIMFSIEKRGVLLKDISIKLRKISRQIKTLQNSDINPKEKMRKLEEYYTEVDDMDLSIFDNNITASSVTKNTNITSGNTSRRGDSDLDSRDDILYESTKQTNELFNQPPLSPKGFNQPPLSPKGFNKSRSKTGFFKRADKPDKLSLPLTTYDIDDEKASPLTATVTSLPTIITPLTTTTTTTTSTTSTTTTKVNPEILTDIVNTTPNSDNKT